MRPPPLVLHAPGQAHLVRRAKLRAELDIRAKPQPSTYVRRGRLLVVRPEVLAASMRVLTEPMRIFPDAAESAMFAADRLRYRVEQRIALEVIDPKAMVRAVSGL